MGITAAGTENSSSSSNNMLTGRQRRLQTGCTTNTYNNHSFLHLHLHSSSSSLHTLNSSTRLYAHVVLSASTAPWTWMSSGPRCPRGTNLDTRSPIQSTRLLTETVPILGRLQTPPHLEAKIWVNTVVQERPMVPLLQVAAPYRGMVKRLQEYATSNTAERAPTRRLLLS